MLDVLSSFFFFFSFSFFFHIFFYFLIHFLPFLLFLPFRYTRFSRVHIAHIRAKVRSYRYKKRDIQLRIRWKQEGSGAWMTLAAAVGSSSFAGTNIKYIPNGKRKRGPFISYFIVFDSRLIFPTLFFVYRSFSSLIYMTSIGQI